MVTPSGDNAIVVQYMTANGFTSSTLGIQDPTQAIGIQCLYNGTYSRGCAPIAAQRAIAYIPMSPEQSGIFQNAASGTTPVKPALAAWPNPFPARSRIQFVVARASRVSLKVYDPTGRAIRTLVNAPMEPGRYSATWDGASDHGTHAPAGIYFVRLETDHTTCEQKVIKLR